MKNKTQCKPTPTHPLSSLLSFKVSTYVSEEEPSNNNEEMVTTHAATKFSSVTDTVTDDSTVTESMITEAVTHASRVSVPISAAASLSAEVTLSFTTPTSVSVFVDTTVTPPQNPIQATFSMSGNYVTVRDQQLLIFTSLTDPPQIVPSTNPFYIQLMTLQNKMGPFDAIVSDTIGLNDVIKIYIGKVNLFRYSDYCSDNRTS